VKDRCYRSARVRDLMSGLGMLGLLVEGSFRVAVLRNDCPSFSAPSPQHLTTLTTLFKSRHANAKSEIIVGSY
jgi:hypothetical protein